MLAQTILISVMLIALLTGLFFNYRQAADLKADIGSLRMELKGDTSSLRSEMKGDISSLRSDLKADIARLDGKLDSLDAKVESKTDGIQADLRQFYHLTGKHEGRLDTMERRLA